MPDPILLPALPYADCEFDPVQPRDTNQMEGRRTEARIYGTPFWRAKYRLEFLRPVHLAALDAFMMQAGDSGETFLGYDISRPRPIAHSNGGPLSGVKAAGGAFNGDATLQAVTNSRAIVVSGLPAGFTLTPGDYVEVRKSQMTRSLHRIMASATANGAGIVNLSIRYGLDVGVFNLPCTVHFEKPACTMQIDPDSWSSSKAMNARTPSFSATEVFLT